jgi:hypothetical protein
MPTRCGSCGPGRRSPTGSGGRCRNSPGWVGQRARGNMGWMALRTLSALLSHRGAPAETILGPVDAMKVRSMATLFAAVPDAPPEFAEILAAFYGSDPCPLTGEALAAS